MGRHPMEANIVPSAFEPLLATLSTFGVLFVTFDLAGSTRPASRECFAVPPRLVRRGRLAGGH